MVLDRFGVVGFGMVGGTEAPAVVVRPVEPGLATLCSNTLLAAKVAMANELSDRCVRSGASWPRVKAVVGLDRRVGADHLSVTAERGFGGACVPGDLDGLIAAATTAGHTAPLLTAIADANRRTRARARTDGDGTPNGHRAGVAATGQRP